VSSETKWSWLWLHLPKHGRPRHIHSGWRSRRGNEEGGHGVYTCRSAAMGKSGGLTLWDSAIHIGGRFVVYGVRACTYMARHVMPDHGVSYGIHACVVPVRCGWITELSRGPRVWICYEPSLEMDGAIWIFGRYRKQRLLGTLLDACGYGRLPCTVATLWQTGTIFKYG
jgi:hypothetical protein